MTKRIPTIIVVFVVCIALFFMLFFFQVRYTETAVVTRFERPVDRAIAPGLNFRYPWPIEQVHKYDSRLRSYETPVTQLSTADQRPLTVSSFVTWRIEDAAHFLKAVGREDAAAEKIGDLLKNAVSKVLKQHPLSDLINPDPAKIQFSKIEQEILESVQKEARSYYGVALVAVGIKRLGLPEKNTEAVANRMKAERQAVSDRLTSEGRAEAEKITSNAESIAKKIQARAAAYATTIVGEGDAIAAKNYEIFKQYPDLANFLKEQEALESIANAGELNLIFNVRDSAIFHPLMPPDQWKKASEKQASAGGQ